MVFPRYVQVLKWRFPVGISIINQLFWGTPIYGNPQMVHVLKCPKPERITSAAEMQWPELRLERQAATRKQGFHRAQCGIFHGIVGVVSIYEDNSIGYFMDILYIYIFHGYAIYIYNISGYGLIFHGWSCWDLTGNHQTSASHGVKTWDEPVTKAMTKLGKHHGFHVLDEQF